ncbi:hypothetical protein ASC81_25335 [Pelomonas sp. Root405]|nr:hypothetical protein ASC81_25335 [Pelomonas sp. Root405]
MSWIFKMPNGPAMPTSTPSHTSQRSTGLGLVDDVQRLAATDEFAQDLVQRREVALDAADMPDLGVARRICHGDVDRCPCERPT